MSRCVIRRAESSTARSVGPRHRLEPAVHSELLEDVLHVVANGGGAQTELCGENLCVGPVRHEPQDLDLALGQAARSLITGAAGPCGQRLYGLHQRPGRAVVSKHAHAHGGIDRRHRDHAEVDPDGLPNLRQGLRLEALDRLADLAPTPPLLTTTGEYLLGQPSDHLLRGPAEDLFGDPVPEPRDRPAPWRRLHPRPPPASGRVSRRRRIRAPRQADGPGLAPVVRSSHLASSSNRRLEVLKEPRNFAVYPVVWRQSSRVPRDGLLRPGRGIRRGHRFDTGRPLAVETLARPGASYRPPPQRYCQAMPMTQTPVSLRL